MPSGVPRIPQPREWVLTKMCSRCGEKKPWALYSPKKYWSDGSVHSVAGPCRQCENVIERSPERRVRKRAWIERNREWRRAYDRKRRDEVRAFKNETHSGRSGVLLPIAPLRAFLAEQQLNRDIDTMAAATGVDERVIRRLMNEASCVALVQADRLITRLGGVLEMVYPYEEEKAA